MKERLHTFAALHWYEECIQFLFTFTAKTSELLLAAGLVVSTANFLTDGSVLGNNAGLAAAWAWAQALAIDSSLGITFYAIFRCVQQRDWIKAALYGLLTLLLAIVAGTITNVETFSHALHISIASSMTQVGLDVKILTTLRAIAVVGFVMMSRLKEVSFKQLYEQTPSPAPLHEPLTQEVIQLLLAHLSPEAGEQMRRALVQRGETTITQELETPVLALSIPQDRKEQEKQDEEQEETQEVRLEHAYQELLASGERISGRSLAKQAHVHRLTCNQWLKQRQPPAEAPGAQAENRAEGEGQ
jgi:hypothetical protein